MPNITLNSSKETAWSGYFKYSISQDIASNYTDIEVSVWAQKEDGHTSGTNSTTWDAKITVNGTSVTLKSGPGYSLRPSGTWIGSDDGSSTGSIASFRVYHSSDGSIDCPISVRVYPASGLSWDNERLTYEGSLSSANGDIPTIPRSSSISSAKNVYFGDNCQVVWTPPSSSFYYKLKFSFGSWSHTTSAINPGTTSAYTYSGYAISMDAANQIPNSISGKMTVTLYSYSDSSCRNQIGSSSTANFVVTLADDVVPTVESCMITKDNSLNDTVKNWDIALAGYTRININATASGAYGSTVTSFNISGGYKASVTGSELNYLGSVIASSGNKQFVITCTDSRGRTSEVYTSDIITIMPYKQPKVKKLSVSKNDDGKMEATAVWEYDTVDGRNMSYAKIYYKITTAENWTEHIGSLINEEPFVLNDLELDEESSYNFRIIVTDTVGNSIEKDAFSSTTKVLMDFQAGGRGLGIGKICEIDNVANGTSSLEVSMDSYFFGNIYMRGDVAMVLSSGMFGSADPSDAVSDPVKGQIYFKRVNS